MRKAIVITTIILLLAGTLGSAIMIYLETSTPAPSVTVSSEAQ